jgi:hypothetical protein
MPGATFSLDFEASTDIHGRFGAMPVVALLCKRHYGTGLSAGMW